jgi:hypothetical protein
MMARNDNKLQGADMKNIEYREYGMMKVNQRTLKDETFPVWTAIQDCEGTECVSARVCPYFSTDINRKCVVMMKYLKQVEKMTLDTFGNEMDDFDLFRVGMHLVPLYKQLARFKIIEMSVTSRGITEMTKSGTTKVNSLFKEIREVVKAIDSTWRELGVVKGKQPESPSIPVGANRSYYEQMEKEALKEQKKLKLVKRK